MNWSDFIRILVGIILVIMVVTVFGYIVPNKLKIESRSKAICSPLTVKTLFIDKNKHYVVCGNHEIRPLSTKEDK